MKSNPPKTIEVSLLCPSAPSYFQSTSQQKLYLFCLRQRFRYPLYSFVWNKHQWPSFRVLLLVLKKFLFLKGRGKIFDSEVIFRKFLIFGIINYWKLKCIKIDEIISLASVIMLYSAPNFLIVPLNRSISRHFSPTPYDQNYGG